METIAFKVKKGSKLYQDYFLEKKEKTFFQKLAGKFFDEHFPEAKVFALTDRLTVGLSEEDAKKYRGQLMKDVTYSHGTPLYQFKRSSPLDKLWVEQVCKRVNGNALHANFWWVLEFSKSGLFKGSKTMWDDKKGNVYGLIETSDSWTHLTVPDMVERIKLSDYYAVAESVYPEEV